MNGWKSEKESIYSFVGKEYACQGLKLLKLGCELKFISPQYEIPCGYFNYYIDNEWNHEKYAHVQKILVLALLYAKLLKSQL